MSDPIKATKEAEELSTLLDLLNAGVTPESQDKETAELLAVAALVKNAAPPARPARVDVEETVEKAMSVLPSGRTERRKPWLYSGAVGIAASLLMMYGLGQFPPGTSQVPTAKAPVASPAPPAPAAGPDGQQQTSAARVSPGESGQSAKTGQAVEAPGKAADTAEIDAGKPASPPPPPDLAQAAQTAQEPAALPGPPKSGKRFAASPPPKAKSLAFSPAVLTLPGQTPDLLTVDKDTGTIRQTFHQGTPEEIIITQRPLIAAAKPSPDAAPGTHTVTVRIFGQEVTVQGQKSPQELQAIAASLKP